MFQSGAFQSYAFQTVSFQSGINVDTHDGLPRKFYLPIYEYTKKHKKIENIIEVEQRAVFSSIDQLPEIPVKAKEWDNSKIEAFAKSTLQSIQNVENQIEAIRKYEEMLDEDERDLMMLAGIIH